MAQRDPYYIVKDEVAETVRAALCCCRRCRYRLLAQVALLGLERRLPASTCYSRSFSICSYAACKTSSADGRACHEVVQTSGR